MKSTFSPDIKKISFEGESVSYENANEMTDFRINSLFTKEPDTVEWIRHFKEGEIFVDIGANVGMYTMLASKVKKVRTYAFEPESQNFACLVRNVFHNNLQELVVPYCLALSDSVKVDKLFLSDFALGTSCHTFGENIDFHLKPRSSTFGQGSVAWTLDKLVRKRIIPFPDHIKIDVDGIEHLVVRGMQKVLSSKKLKSVLIEVNTQLKEHQEIIKLMKKKGFVFSEHQINIAIREEGAFKGVGNFIFYRPDSGISFSNLGITASKKEIEKKVLNPEAILEHMSDAISNAKFVNLPYPHFCIENIFPDEFYQNIMLNKPDASSLSTLKDLGRAGYDNRYALLPTDESLGKISKNQRKFWSGFFEYILLAEPLMREVMDKFICNLDDEDIRQKLIDTLVKKDALFMRDMPGYKIGPHTDVISRICTMMIYLPDDAKNIGSGTSIYTNENSKFVSDGTEHFDNDGSFKIFRTLDYRPNTAFCFLRTDNSFHGVEPYMGSSLRDTIALIYRQPS